MLKDAFIFFEKNIDVDRPILVGLSGGPDSLCVLHLLLAWNKAPVHIVHINHGWRDESGRECEVLQKLADELKVPFHYTKLDPATYEGNKEAESRKERYAFFTKIALRTGAQGIVLGHQADDVSETVLKRVLEGANLTALGGMDFLGEYGSLKIFRPLLAITKNEVITWLDDKKIEYFTDPTNTQKQYLRGRMRAQIFPYLKEHFAKEFEKSLVSVSAEANELKKYLDNKCSTLQSITGPWGTYFESLPKEVVELKHLIRSQKLVLSRSQMQSACTIITEHTADKQLTTSNGSLYLDRARAFFIKKPLDKLQSTLFFNKPGSYLFEGWHVKVEQTTALMTPKNHFTDAWKGDLCTFVPMGDYLLSKSTPSMLIYKKKYNHFLNEKKVPHLFTEYVPVLTQNNTIIEDFLTGNAINLPASPFLKITLIQG
ncbi:MAG: tRNA lysidine(34) synthetase TilS [Chlamydiales bacterium]|nr:tRNA lysidine(34) synthetase TilS [Chlamydiales bacterium]